jgi:hypothetical protein
MKPKEVIDKVTYALRDAVKTYLRRQTTVSASAAKSKATQVKVSRNDSNKTVTGNILLTSREFDRSSFQVTMESGINTTVNVPPPPVVATGSETTTDSKMPSVKDFSNAFQYDTMSPHNLSQQGVPMAYNATSVWSGYSNVTHSIASVPRQNHDNIPSEIDTLYGRYLLRGNRTSTPSAPTMSTIGALERQQDVSTFANEASALTGSSGGLFASNINLSATQVDRYSGIASLNTNDNESSSDVSESEKVD